MSTTKRTIAVSEVWADLKTLHCVAVDDAITQWKNLYLLSSISTVFSNPEAQVG